MRNVYFVGILAIASVLLLNAVVVAQVEIALEAELADKIQAPMAIGTVADVEDVGGPVPDEPSNGEFVWHPGAPLTGGGGSGYVEFIVNLPESGTYAVWGRCVSWDGNSDSFWVTWQPADPNENPQATQNTEFRWSTGSGAAWYWRRINAWLNAGTVQREWTFDSAGETKLAIWSREDATMLDCLYITDDILAGDVDRRVPDDDDRKLQVEGVRQAVEAEGKLPITWGFIRSQHGG
jgi:hypothetical protein